MRSRHLLLASVAFVVGACSVGPDYERPPAPVPTAYKEIGYGKQQGNWKPAEPRDDMNRGPWWHIYNDPVLDDLAEQVEVSNQNLKAFEASYRQAQSLVRESASGYYPTIGVDGNRTRSGQRSTTTSSTATQLRTITQYTASVTATWEPDLWGRIGRLVESDATAAQASAGDLAAARLSAQAALASNYFTLRVNDELKRLLDSEVDAFARSLQITRNRYTSGTAARSDVASAQAQLESTRALAINVGVQRATLEHAIAVLIGKPPSDFSIPPAVAPIEVAIPIVPTDVPSTLLERRPDIAAAERRMASANALIGVAKAAYYPTFTLTGQYGFASTMWSGLFSAANSLWSYGTDVAATLYDGGLRSAQVDFARAGYDFNVANYRQIVLTGFQQVEDQLATLRILEQQAEVQDLAVSAAREAERLTLNQYLAGTVDYTTVITAQTVALGNAQTALNILQARLASSVALIQGLGGGWDAAQLPAFADVRNGTPLRQAGGTTQP
jgi:NodT family efflux transporter outer membrane factor (OMF) lipoprotein